MTTISEILEQVNDGRYVPFKTRLDGLNLDELLKLASAGEDANAETLQELQRQIDRLQSAYNRIEAVYNGYIELQHDIIDQKEAALLR